MKKNMYCLLVTVLMLSATYAQETSLTIDCQTPGWLSSKITYPQQQTLENLKVSGYINGTDIKFIRELNKSLKLHGVIDLGDANIVSGGESYYTYNTTNYTTKTNEITGYMFAQLDSIQKVVLPHSTISFSGSYQFLNTYVDTLVINGIMENLSVADGYNNIFWKTRCIYFPEGLKTLNLNYLFHSYSKLTNQELFFPSTIETFTGNGAATSDKNIIFHCESTAPENIKVIGFTDNNFSFFDGGTIYVPKGTKSSYEKSVFRKLTIIEDISVDSIKCESATLSTYVGEEFECKATLFPSDAIYKNIEYEVSDSALLNIIGNGYFLSKAYGTGYIYAYSHNREFVDSCEVQIYNHTTGIDIDKSSANVKIGGTIQLIASTLPEQTSDNRVTYSSTDNNTAIVNEEGTVYGLKPGICVIKAKSVDGGYTAECVVTVEQSVGTVELNEHNISLNVGEVKQLGVTVLPTNADNKSLVWSSSNSEVVTVDENGEIEALQTGNAYIKVVSVDNPSALDSCIVSVVQPTTGITLSHVNHTFNAIGESVQLTAFVSPENATNKNVKWTSSNESVCIVNNGLVIGVGEGTAVIIATTEDGGHMATCVITVKNKEYLLTYVLDGKVYYAESLAEGEVITPLEEPTKEGYTFSGWSEIPGTMPADNVTITGTFTVNQYNVTFMIDGAEFATVAVNYGESITTPEVPAREGYAFAWTDEIPETMPAKDIVINGAYSIIDDISNVVVKDEILHIYTLDGQRTSRLHQGLNIVRMKDGSIRKLFHK